MEILDDITLENIVRLTGNGRKPAYIKITNGDNNGSDPNYPDYYRFDYSNPMLNQIEDHINEAFSNDSESIGVNKFVTAVMMSRNLDVKNFKCVRGDPKNAGKRIAILPDRTEINDGCVTFDWTMFKIWEMIGSSINRIDAGVTVFGSFGKELQENFASLIPSIITGPLIFKSSNHSIPISPDVSEIEGRLWADNISFKTWSPKRIGTKGTTATMFRKCASLPNLKNCKMEGSFTFYKSAVDVNNFPSFINGDLLLIGCNIIKPEFLPDVSGNMMITCDRTLDLSELKNKPKIGGNLIVSKDLVDSGLLKKEDLLDKFDVKKDIKFEEDSDLIRDMDGLTSGVFLNQGDKELSKYAKAGIDFVEETFGSLGLAALGGLYKSITGKEMPVK